MADASARINQGARLRADSSREVGMPDDKHGVNAPASPRVNLLSPNKMQLPDRKNAYL